VKNELKKSNEKKVLGQAKHFHIYIIILFFYKTFRSLFLLVTNV